MWALKKFFLLASIWALNDVCQWGVSASLGDDGAMLHAARDGDLNKIVEFVRDKRVSLTVKNNNGVSAIIFAANNGHLEVVKELINMGAKIDDRSNNLKTPLLWASLWGHEPVVKLLVERGANISAKDREGLTPLMSATINNHVSIAKYLLDKGANPLTKNIYNATAFSIAQTKSHTELVDILQPYFNHQRDQSPYAVLARMIADEISLALQIALDISCSLCEVPPMSNEELVIALKKEISTGFPSTRFSLWSFYSAVFEEITDNIIPVVKGELLVWYDIIQTRNWDMLQERCVAVLQSTETMLRELVASHVQEIFPTVAEGSIASSSSASEL